MKKTYITTSIAYVNAEPHIGFLFELLAGDVLKRYHQSLGEEVFLLTGTDEHGIKVAQAATAAGRQPQEFVDEVSKKFESLGGDFNIDFDYFIHTTDSKHLEFVQEKWQQLKKGGYLTEKEYAGLYCRGCEAFKPDSETKDGKCDIHETELEKVAEKNWFFDGVKKHRAEITTWIQSGVFPESRRQEVTNVLRSGAYDEVSLSRSKERYGWGVPVPGDDDQIMYVWIDALFNYLSALKINNKEDLWPADIQIIGKDIVKFHAIIWPALLLSCGYDLPKKLFVHGFVNVEGKKMSKSLGNVVKPQQLLDRYAVAGDFAVDAVRYLLFRQLSFDDDSNFVWEDFDRLYNGELVNGLGNLLQRVVKLTAKLSPKDRVRIKSVIDIALQSPYTEADTSNPFDFRDRLDLASLKVAEGDLWITQHKPWENVSALDWAMFVDQTQLVNIAELLRPFMPHTAAEIRRQLVELDPKPLFPRLH